MAAQQSGIGLERRVVGLPTAIGTTFSLIVASSVLATVAGGFFASWVWLIALAIGFVTMIFASMSFSELATMIPKAGSMNEYVRAGLGPFFATVTVAIGYIAVQTFPGTAEAYVSGARHERRARRPGSTTSGWVLDLHRLPGGASICSGSGPSRYSRSTLTFAVALSLLDRRASWAWPALGANDPIGSALPDIDLSWSLLSALLGISIFTFVGVEYTLPARRGAEAPGP